MIKKHQASQDTPYPESLAIEYVCGLIVGGRALQHHFCAILHQQTALPPFNFIVILLCHD